MQVNHQLAIVKAIFRLGIERGEVIFRLAFARHHADIVAANQRIQPGNTRKRRLGCDQPKLGIFTQRVFHIAFHADFYFDFAQVFTEADALYRTDFNTLVTYRRAPGNDAVSRNKINGRSRAAFFPGRPHQPAGNHQCDNWQ